LRHAQELLFKLADDHVGALDQRGHFVQQGFVFDGAGTVADLGGGSGELARDLSLALGKGGDHRAVFLQRGGVAVGVLQHHGRHGSFKTVAGGAVARRETQRLDGHHGAAMQCHQAVRGAHKVHAGPAGQLAIGFELVAHHLGDGELGNGFVQRLLQASRQRGAGHHAVVEQGFGLAVLRALERGHGGCGVGHIGAQRLQLFEQCGGGVAVLVQADGHGHELLLHSLVGGLVGHGGHMRSQAAGRGKWRDHRSGRRQALGLELVAQHGGKGIAQLLQRLGGQFFNKQFNEEVLGRHVLVLSLVHAAFLTICSTHSRGAMGKPRRSRLS